MTNKKKAQDGEEKERAEEKEVLTQPETVKAAPLYQAAKWAGVLDTFRCVTCGHCDPDQDNMILHVLNHVPETERDEVFTRLLQDKE